MADGTGSGGIGLLGVVIGAAIVVVLGYMFLTNGGGNGPAKTPNVNITVPKTN